MVSLFDLLKNIGQKVRTKGNNLYQGLANDEMQPLQPQVNIEAIQLDSNGQAIPGAEIHPMRRGGELATRLGFNVGNKVEGVRNKLYESLLGGQAKPTDNAEMVDGVMNITTSENPRQGGILRDISSGYRENRTTPASLDNFGQNELADGRQKGFAYRLGEGLGSLARFGESSLGRGVLVGGAIGALGGNPAEMLGYGAGATMLNQANKLNDKLYRRNLIENEKANLRNKPGFNMLPIEEQQRLMTEVENRVNSMRGYVSGQAYKNMIDAQTLRDNADFKRMYYENQAQEQRDLMDWKKAQAEKENRIAERELALKGNQLSSDDRYKQGQLDLQRKELDYKQNPLPKIDPAQIQKIQSITKQISNFENMFDVLPGKLESMTLGNLRNRTGFETANEATFNSQKTLLFNKIARDLGGEKGPLSDQDIKNVERSLPKLTDSIEQKRAKMKAVKQLIQIRLEEATGGQGGYVVPTETNTAQPKQDSLGIL